MTSKYLLLFSSFDISLVLIHTFPFPFGLKLDSWAAIEGSGAVRSPSCLSAGVIGPQKLIPYTFIS